MGASARQANHVARNQPVLAARLKHFLIERSVTYLSDSTAAISFMSPFGA